MQNNFNRVWHLWIVVWVLYVCVCMSKQQVFTPLYRGVKDTLEIASTSKRVVWSLIKITNDLFPDTVIVLWRINFKFIPSLKGHWCRHRCFSCPVADTKESSGDSGFTVRTIVLCQLSPTEKHRMPSNPFELDVALFFQSSAMLDEIKSIEQPFEALILSASDDLQLLMKTASGDVAFDDISTSGALCLQNLFSSDASNFLLVDSIALICSSRPYASKIDTTFLSLVLHTWTNIRIFNWQFLIPCYHQNSKGNVKHILFQQSPPFWWWQTLVFKMFNCC